VGEADRYQANPSSEVNGNMSAFAEHEGGNTLYVKAFLVSDGELVV